MTCSACQPQNALSVVRGESKTFLITVRDEQRNLIDLTGALAWFTVKNRVEDVSSVISKRNLAAGGVDGQILITLPQTGVSLGQMQVFLTPPDSAELDPGAAFWCDSWIQLTSGNRYQILSNQPFAVLPAITTRFF